MIMAQVVGAIIPKGLKDMNELLAWHFLPAPDKNGEIKTRFSNEPVFTGSVHTTNKPVIVGDFGYHACDNIYDACIFSKGTTLSRVCLAGDIQYLNQISLSMHAASTRIVLWYKPLTPVMIREIGIHITEAYLREMNITDKALWKAVDLTKQYVAGNATEQDLENYSSTVRNLKYGLLVHSMLVGGLSLCPLTYWEYNLFAYVTKIKKDLDKILIPLVESW